MECRVNSAPKHKCLITSHRMINSILNLKPPTFYQYHNDEKSRGLQYKIFLHDLRRSQNQRQKTMNSFNPLQTGPTQTTHYHSNSQLNSHFSNLKVSPSQQYQSPTSNLVVQEQHMDSMVRKTFKKVQDYYDDNQYRILASRCSPHSQRTLTHQNYRAIESPFSIKKSRIKPHLLLCSQLISPLTQEATPKMNAMCQTTDILNSKLNKTHSQKIKNDQVLVGSPNQGSLIVVKLWQTDKSSIRRKSKQAQYIDQLQLKQVRKHSSQEQNKQNFKINQKNFARYDQIDV